MALISKKEGTGHNTSQCVLQQKERGTCTLVQAPTVLGRINNWWYGYVWRGRLIGYLRWDRDFCNLEIFEFFHIYTIPFHNNFFIFCELINTMKYHKLSL